MGITTRRYQHGYTLVELMIVVAIIGLLASLAVYGVRRYILAAKSAEAIEVINNIRAAQEQYKDERFRYLDISDVSSSSGSFFPFANKAALKNGKVAWTDAGTIGAGWAQLGVAPSAPVTFGYACRAGQGNGVPSQATLGTATNLKYPATAPNWYVVRAAADHDADGKLALFVGSNFTDEIYGENETE